MTRLADRTQNNERQPPFRIGELLHPNVFPHSTKHIELRETHISWVILTGQFAYKIKKPVKFDFIDCSTLDKRRQLCEEEVRLNRRYAADLYIDVVPIVREGHRLSIAVAGTPIEYAVRMQQFDASSELLALLNANAVAADDMLALAERIAEFHLQATVIRDIVPQRITQSMYEAVIGNLTQLTNHLEQIDPRFTLARLVDWTQDALHALESSFELRSASGCIRDCHGDLHAGNIARWQGQLLPFDCIEFNPQLRHIDVIDDLSFLVMDLASHKRDDLAFALLSRYLEITGDYDGVPLIRFYAVYRALVRARVDALAAEQVPQRASEFHQRLFRRVRSAVDWTKPQRPLLILMHGCSGSGKTWLSERLVPNLPAIRIRSDVERKRLAGIAPRESAAAEFAQGIYSDAFNHRTYARLADCTESCLRAGFTAIVDATFLDIADRELFRRLAARLRACYSIVSCHADVSTLTKRISQRSRSGQDASDADLATLDAQLRGLQAFAAAEQQHVISVATTDANAVQRVVTSIKALSNAAA